MKRMLRNHLNEKQLLSHVDELMGSIVLHVNYRDLRESGYGYSHLGSERRRLVSSRSNGEQDREQLMFIICELKYV